MKKIFLSLIFFSSWCFSQIPDYERERFPHWRDLDRDCQNAREESLKKYSIFVFWTNDKCTPIIGLWHSYYDSKWYMFSSELDVDHIVPLSHAWRNGAWKWTEEKRTAFANDVDNLIPVSASSNRSKGDKSILDWMPTNEKYHCMYVSSWFLVKSKYNLEISQQEQNLANAFKIKC